MANYINNTAQGFTQVPNNILNHPGLSLKAKALWAFLASKPSGWDFSAERIATQNQDGKESVGSGLRELEAAGLLKRETKSRGYRQFETTYTLTAEIADGKIAAVKYANDLIVNEKPGNISNKDISNKEKSNKEIIMSPPAKPAATREIPQEAYQLAEILHEKILENKPDRRIEQGWRERWAKDIDKLNRIDKKPWAEIGSLILWSQQDEFWHQNILSGGKLRKHYDRMEDRKRSQGRNSRALANKIQSLSAEEAIELARRTGAIKD